MLLCATSVSSASLWWVAPEKTTETQRTQRSHREAHTSIQGVGSFGKERLTSVKPTNSGALSCKATSALILARYGLFARCERWASTMYFAQPSKPLRIQSARSSLERCPKRDKIRCFSSQG